MGKDIKDRLIRIERFIVLYGKAWGQPLKEIKIENISFETLKNIVIPKKDDPLLYDGYILDITQLESLNKLIENKINININSFNYILECNGIYDWS